MSQLLSQLNEDCFITEKEKEAIIQQQASSQIRSPSRGERTIMQLIKEGGIYEMHKTATDHTVLCYDELPQESDEFTGQTPKHKIVRVLFENPVIPDDIKVDESPITSWTSSPYSISRYLNDSISSWTSEASWDEIDPNIISPVKTPNTTPIKSYTQELTSTATSAGSRGLSRPRPWVRGNLLINFRSCGDELLDI